MALKAAFIFVAPEADAGNTGGSGDSRSGVDRGWVKDYRTAAKAAEELVAQGVSAIELCGAFWHRGHRSSEESG